MRDASLVSLQREEEIVAEAMERARLEEEARTRNDVRSNTAHENEEYYEYDDPRQRREIEV